MDARLSKSGAPPNFFGGNPSRSLRGKRDGPAGAKTDNSIRRKVSVVKNIIFIDSPIRMSCGNLFERKEKAKERTHPLPKSNAQRMGHPRVGYSFIFGLFRSSAPPARICSIAGRMKRNSPPSGRHSRSTRFSCRPVRNVSERLIRMRRTKNSANRIGRHNQILILRTPPSTYCNTA